jgi:hypothetical protein
MLKNKFILIGCVITIILGSLTVFGQETKIALKDKRITIQMTQKPLYTIFWRLIQKYDVAIGLEESILDRDHRHYYFETNLLTKKYMPEYKDQKPPVSEFSENLITINLKDAKLEDVVDAIVKQMENYDWEINDGVVNIFPIRGRDERLKKLLDTKVRVFGIGRGSDVGSIQAQIMLFLPEFKVFLAENKLEARTDRNGSDFEDQSLPDGMEFTDMTFKQLLNAITKSKRGGWMLQIKNDLKAKPGQEFIEIFI